MKGWSAKAHWPGSPEGEYAIDWYAGPLGTEFGWPVGGRTRGRGDAGPLFINTLGHDCISVPSEGHVSQIRLDACRGEHPALEIKVCRFGHNDWRPLPAGHVFIPEGYTLWTLILDADDGQTMFAFTHVLKDALLNVHVEPHQKFVKIGDSGLEPFTARNQNPAHIHLAIKVDRNDFGRWQGGMGNVRPWYWLKENGFTVREVARVPSPNDYMNGYINREPY